MELLVWISLRTYFLTESPYFSITNWTTDLKQVEDSYSLLVFPLCPSHSFSKEWLKLNSSSFLRLFEAVCLFSRSPVFVVYLRSHAALKQAFKQETRLSVGSVGSCIGLRESEWVGGAHQKCFCVCYIPQSTKPAQDNQWIETWRNSLYNHNPPVCVFQRVSLYPIWGCVSFFLLITH